MSRRRRKKSPTGKPNSSTQVHDTSSNTQFQLCHFCYFLNESVSEILNCHRCGRALAERQGGADPLDMSEGDQAWADPNKGFLKVEDLREGAHASADDEYGEDEEPEEGEDAEMFSRRRGLYVAGLKVLW